MKQWIEICVPHGQVHTLPGPTVIKHENILKDFSIQIYLKEKKFMKMIISIYDHCKVF